MNELVVICLAVAVLIVVIVIAFWGVMWISFGLMVLLALFRGDGGRSREPPEEYRARRREPQFDVLAAHYGAPVPESLKRLYQNADLLEQEEFSLADPDSPDPYASYFIRRFLPADQKALEDMPRKLREPFFPFAADGFGNYYCVLIRGGAQDSCPVYFWRHRRPSSLEEMKIAASLAVFITRPLRSGHSAEAAR